MRILALPAAVVLIGLTAIPPAFARPPTTTTSPGYDRRLEESRRTLAQDATPQPRALPPGAYLDDRRMPRKPKPQR